MQLGGNALRGTRPSDASHTQVAGAGTPPDTQIECCAEPSHGNVHRLETALPVAQHRAVLRGVACLAATWALLSVVTTLLSPVIGNDWALVVALALAVPLLAWVAYRNDHPRWTWADLEPCGFALVLGVFLLPLIFFHVGKPELFDPSYRAEHPRQPQPLALWLSLALLGPILEEFLHRKLLLEALARPCGSVIALALSTALYLGAPVAPWSLAGTAVAAVLFGVLMLTGKSVPLCVGMHVGFNCAALWTGIHVWQAPLPIVNLSLPLLGVAAAGAVLGIRFSLRPAPAVNHFTPRTPRDRSE